MTQLTIKPTPYHLTLPDRAPIKDTAQIALAEWMKASEATSLQHLSEEPGFTVYVTEIVPTPQLVDDHYIITLDGVRMFASSGQTARDLITASDWTAPVAGGSK